MFRARNPNRELKSPRRKLAFTGEEEHIIGDMLLKFSDLVVPLNRIHLQEAVCTFIETMTPSAGPN